MPVDRPPLILIVDDDDVTRLLAAEALAGAGLATVEAADGIEALAVHAARAPDLVLLDVNMPRLGGHEVCRRLRAMPSGAATAVLMMTATDDVEAVEEAFRVGATDFLTKPLNLPLLAHRIRYLLRATAAIDAEREHTHLLERVRRLARLVHWRIGAGGFAWSCDAAAVLWPDAPPGWIPPAALGELVHPDDRAAVDAALASVAAHQLDFRLALPDGSERRVHQEAELVDDHGVPVLIGATQDVTELRAAERQIAQLAFSDDLTGLPSRAFLHRYLRRVLGEVRRDGGELTVLSIGLALGASPGAVTPAERDELRRAIAGRVIQHVRGADLALRLDQPIGDPDDWAGGAVVARLGSDELIVVLRDERARACGPVATRIAAALAEGYRVGGHELFATPSIGIAIASDAGGDVRELIEYARAASHHARLTGLTIDWFSSALHLQARRDGELERRLRTAVAHLKEPDAAHGFAVHYQPKISRATGAVVGVEALIRWSPDDGPPVSPGEFIPIAERSSAISTLGDWVLHQACVQGAAWAAAGTPVRVAVNISAHQFRASGFVDQIVAIASAAGFDLAALELEITEHATVHDFEQAATTLHALRARGVRVALDDFGVGQSSLSYLARLPVDVVKIDRSFITGLGHERTSDAIVSAVMAMARSLGMTVVAEGVETDEQVRLLGRYPHCEIQGYYCARPQPAAALASLLATGFTWRPEVEAEAFELEVEVSASRLIAYQ